MFKLKRMISIFVLIFYCITLNPVWASSIFNNSGNYDQRIFDQKLQQIFNYSDTDEIYFKTEELLNESIELWENQNLEIFHQNPEYYFKLKNNFSDKLQKTLDQKITQWKKNHYFNTKEFDAYLKIKNDIQKENLFEQNKNDLKEKILTDVIKSFNFYIDQNLCALENEFDRIYQIELNKFNKDKKDQTDKTDFPALIEQVKNQADLQGQRIIECINLQMKDPQLDYIQLDENKTIEEFNNEYQKAIELWEQAEQQILNNRQEWESQVQNNFLNQENIWIETYQNFIKNKQEWCTQLQEKISAAQENCNENLQNQIVSIQNQLDQFNLSLENQETNFLNQLEDAFTIYQSCRIMMKYCQDGISNWYDCYSKGLVNLRTEFLQCQDTNEEFISLKRNYNRGTNYLLYQKKIINDKTDLERFISDICFTQNVSEYFSDNFMDSDSLKEILDWVQTYKSNYDLMNEQIDFIKQTGDSLIKQTGVYPQMKNRIEELKEDKKLVEFELNVNKSICNFLENDYDNPQAVDKMLQLINNFKEEYSILEKEYNSKISELKNQQQQLNELQKELLVQIQNAQNYKTDYEESIKVYDNLLKLKNPDEKNNVINSMKILRDLISDIDSISESKLRENVENYYKLNNELESNELFGLVNQLKENYEYYSSQIMDKEKTNVLELQEKIKSFEKEKTDGSLISSNIIIKKLSDIKIQSLQLNAVTQEIVDLYIDENLKYYSYFWNKRIDDNVIDKNIVDKVEQLELIKNLSGDPECIPKIFNIINFFELDNDLQDKLIEFAAKSYHLFVFDQIKDLQVKSLIQNKFVQEQNEIRRIDEQYQNVLNYISGNDYILDSDVEKIFKAQNLLNQFKIVQNKQSDNLENQDLLFLNCLEQDSLLLIDFIQKFDEGNSLDVIFTNYSHKEFTDYFYSILGDSASNEDDIPVRILNCLNSTVEYFTSGLNQNELENFENIFENKNNFLDYYKNRSMNYAEEQNLILEENFSDQISDFNNNLIFDKQKANSIWYVYYMAGAKNLYSYCALNYNSEEIPEIIEYIEETGFELNQELEKFIQANKIISVKDESNLSILSEMEVNKFYENQIYGINPMYELPGFDHSLNRDGLFYKYSNECASVIQDKINKILPDYYFQKFINKVNSYYFNKPLQKLEINGIDEIQNVEQEENYLNVYKDFLLTLDGNIYSSYSDASLINPEDKKYKDVNSIILKPDFDKRKEFINEFKNQYNLFNKVLLNESSLKDEIELAASEMTDAQKSYNNQNEILKNLYDKIQAGQNDYNQNYQNLLKLKDSLNEITDKINTQEIVLNYATGNLSKIGFDKNNQLYEFNNRILESEELLKSINDEINDCSTKIALISVGETELEMPQSLDNYLISFEDSYTLNVLGNEINAEYLKCVNQLENAKQSNENFLNQICKTDDKDLQNSIIELLEKIESFKDKDLFNKLVLAQWFEHKENYDFLFNESLGDLTGKYRQYDFTFEYNNWAKVLFEENHNLVINSYPQEFNKLVELYSYINLDYFDINRNVADYLHSIAAQKVEDDFKLSIEKKQKSEFVMACCSIVAPLSVVFVPIIIGMEHSCSSERNYIDAVKGYKENMYTKSHGSFNQLQNFTVVLDQNKKMINYYQSNIDRYKGGDDNQMLSFEDFRNQVYRELTDTSAIKKNEFWNLQIDNKSLSEIFKGLENKKLNSVYTIYEAILENNTKDFGEILNKFETEVESNDYSQEIILSNIINKQIEIFSKNKMNYLGVTEDYQIDLFKQLMLNIQNLVELNNRSEYSNFENKLLTDLNKSKFVLKSQLESLNLMLENCIDYWDKAICDLESQKVDWENSFVNQYQLQKTKWENEIIDFYSKKEEWICSNYSNLISPGNINFNFNDFENMENFGNVKNFLSQYSKDISSGLTLNKIISESASLMDRIVNSSVSYSPIDSSLLPVSNSNIQSKALIFEIEKEIETASNRLNESYAKSQLLELWNYLENEILNNNCNYKNYYEDLLLKDGYTIDSTIHRNVLVDSSASSDKFEYQTVEKYKFFEYDSSEKNNFLQNSTRSINSFSYGRKYIENLMDKIFGTDGLFSEHIGFAGTFVSNVDINKSLSENLCDEGKGQESIIINQYVFNSYKAKYGYEENGKAFYDKKLWLPTNDFFTPPSIRDLASIGTQIVSKASGIPLLSNADDLFFGIIDGITGNKKWESVIFDFSKIVVREMAGALTGDIFSEYSSKLKEIAGPLNAQLIENAGKNLVNTAVNSVYYDESKDGLAFNGSVFKDYFFDTIAGGLSAYTTDYLGKLDLKTVFGIDLSERVFDLNGINRFNSMSGQIVGDAFKFAATGSLDLNILSAGDTGLFEVHLGKDGIHTNIGMNGSNYNILEFGNYLQAVQEASKVLKKKFGSIEEQQLLEIVNVLGYGKSTNLELAKTIWGGDADIEFMNMQEMIDFQKQYSESTNEIARGMNLENRIILSQDNNRFDSLQEIIKSASVVAHENSHRLGENIESNAFLEGFVTYDYLCNQFRIQKDMNFNQEIILNFSKDSNQIPSEDKLQFWKMYVDAYCGHLIVPDGNNQLSIAQLGNVYDQNGNWSPQKVSEIVSMLNESSEIDNKKINIIKTEIVKNKITDEQQKITYEGDEKNPTVVNEDPTEDLNILTYSQAGALTKILGLNRVEKLLESSVLDFNTYDKEVVMEALKMSSDDYDLIARENTFADQIKTVQNLYNLAGLQLMNNQKKAGTIGFTAYDTEIREGYAFGQNDDGRYLFTTVYADVYRDPESYNCLTMTKRSPMDSTKIAVEKGIEKLSKFINSDDPDKKIEQFTAKDKVQIQWDIQMDNDKRAKDVIVYNIKGLNYELTGENYDYSKPLVIDNYQTVDNMAFSQSCPDVDRNQPYYKDGKYVQGNTIMGDINFAYGTSKEYSSNSYVENVLVANNGTTMQGSKIGNNGKDDSSDLRFLAHGSDYITDEIVKSSNPTSDGCFVTTQENQKKLMNTLALWKIPENTQIRFHLKDSAYANKK